MSVTLQQPSFKILFLGICRIQNCNIAGMMQDKKRKVQSELIQVCNQAWSWYFERCVLKLIFKKCFLYISLTLFKELDTMLQSIVPFLTSCGILLDAGSASVKWHISKFLYKIFFHFFSYIEDAQGRRKSTISETNIIRMHFCKFTHNSEIRT